MARPRPHLESRVAKLERAVVLLGAWVQECKDLGLSGRVISEVAFRGVQEGRTGFATAQCSAEEFLKTFSEQFVRNVKRRLGKRVDLSRPERVKATRRGR